MLYGCQVSYTHFMNKRPTRLFFVLLFLVPTSVFSINPDLSAVFQNHAVTGTIVLESLQTRKRLVHNRQRLDQRFLPASTFKIPNTLIALENGAVDGPFEVIRWDGREHRVKGWNRDHCLVTALPASCVWFYQELARRIGMETYRRTLERISYGNGRTGPRLDTFWLDGDIRISANEQIAFLKKLYRDELPFTVRHQHLVKHLMRVGQAGKRILRAKTGWALRDGHDIGWYVGWVEVPGDVWFFALNMDIPTADHAVLRQTIAMACLATAGIYPETDGDDPGPLAIPFKLDRNKVTLEAAIGRSRPLSILLDTGMPFNGLLLYKTDLKACMRGDGKPGFIVGGAGSENPSTATLWERVTVRLDGSFLPNQQVLIIDGDRFAGFPSDGVIGGSLFSRYAVEIDHDGGRIRLHEPDQWQPDGTWFRLPLTFRDNRIPWIEVVARTDGGTLRKFHCYIDLASSETIEVLTGNDRGVHVPEDALPAMLGAGMNGEIHGHRGRMAELRIGPFTLQDLAAVYVPAAVRSRQAGADAVISNGLLKQFNLLFDLTNRQLYLKPNHLFGVRP